jgi:hypothetical protein
MPVEHPLLFAGRQQLTAACRAWVADKSKPLADLLVERGVQHERAAVVFGWG